MRKKSYCLKLASIIFCIMSAPKALCAEYSSISEVNQSEKTQATGESTSPNPDSMRQLAAKQAADGRLVLALDTIEQAQSLAPFDNDIALANARILFWLGRVAEARKQADVVRARAPAYTDLQVLDASMNASITHRSARTGFALSAGFANVQLDGGQSQSWESLALSGFIDFDANTNIAATIEHEQRRTNDTRLSLITTRTVKAWDIRAGITYTPSADFREDWGFQAGADLKILNNVTLLSDVRYADYGNISVVSVIPGIKLSSSDATHNLAVRLISIKPSDSTTKLGASARYDRNFDTGLRLFGGVASYPDTEAGLTRQLRSAFLGGALPLSNKLSLMFTGEYDRRERSYTRRALSLTLIFRRAN